MSLRNEALGLLLPDNVYCLSEAVPPTVHTFHRAETRRVQTAYLDTTCEMALSLAHPPCARASLHAATLAHPGFPCRCDYSRAHRQGVRPEVRLKTLAPYVSSDAWGSACANVATLPSRYPPSGASRSTGRHVPTRSWYGGVPCRRLWSSPLMNPCWPPGHRALCVRLVWCWPSFLGALPLSLPIGGLGRCASQGPCRAWGPRSRGLFNGVRLPYRAKWASPTWGHHLRHSPGACFAASRVQQPAMLPERHSTGQTA